MMKNTKPCVVMAALLLMIGGLVSHDARAATDCVGLRSILNNNPARADEGFGEAILKWLSGGSGDVECGSLTSVMDKVVKRNKIGGKRLKEDGPFSVAKGQSDLDAALSKPDIKARFDKLKANMTDDKARTYLEAAILDEEGHYDARELRLQQLLETTK